MKEQLQDKIMSRIIKDDDSGCWIWQGQISNSGYGKLQIKDEVYGTKTESAQIVSYMAFVESSTEGKLIHTSCKNRLCVNPEHLVPHNKT